MKKHNISGTGLDPTIAFADLAIDDVTYKLAYSFNSIRLAEHEIGENLLSTGMRSMLNLSATALLGLFWASLLIAQPEITLLQAANLIRFDTMDAVQLALMQAFTLSLPKKKQAELEAAEESQPATSTLG